MVSIRKRRLGRTNLWVSEVGLGAMDTPRSPDGAATIRSAIEVGINFIDTAREYDGSEFLIGQVLREGLAHDVYLETKTFARDTDACQHAVDRSLAVLGVRQIDIYQLHDVSTLDHWRQVMRDDEGALAGLKIARARGLINYIGISSHNSEILRLAIASNEFDVVMVEYSAFFRESEWVIELAQEKDIGVVAMRPLGGSGRMSALKTMKRDRPEQIALSPGMLLGYVLANPLLSLAIPGVSHPARILENANLPSNYVDMDLATKRECERLASEFIAQ